MKSKKSVHKKEEAPKESLANLTKRAEQVEKRAREQLHKLKEKHVGAKIRKLRAEQGHSQLDVSRNTGLSQSYLSRIESGDVVTPSRDVLERLAFFFQIAPRSLTEGTSSALLMLMDDVRLADRYGYCPNVECPGTAYSFFSDVADGRVNYTVKEFFSVQEAYYGGFTLPQDYLATEYRGEKLEKFRAKRRDLKITYRWIELDENTKFCELCGTKLRSSCPHCEIPLKVRNQEFCHHCGRQLNKPPEQEKGGKEK